MKCIIYFMVFVLCIEFISCQFQREKIIGKKPIDQSDAYLKTPELGAKYGLTIESHEVVTDDGYILTLHRVPAYGKPVLVLIHGYPSSSREWFLPLSGSTEDSLGYLASKAGYDLWLFNNRGNPYSMKHVNLKSNAPEFWDFGIDEQAEFDFPACMDTILSKSNQTKVTVLGVSLGGIIALKSLARYPHYNDNLKLFIGYATTGGYLGNMTSALTRFCAGLASPEEPLKSLLFRFTRGQIVPDYMRRVLQTFYKRFCQKNYAYLCDNLIWAVSGFSPGKWIDDAVELTIAQFPASSSMRSIIQLAQGVNNYNNGNPKSPSLYYDFGKEKNLELYSRETPPEYDMRKITAPVYLYSGITDGLVSPNDVEYLASFLPNLVQHKIIDYEGSWAHGDFYIAKMAREVIYEPTLELINKFNLKKQ